MIGADAVITKDVTAHAMLIARVLAKCVYWMCEYKWISFRTGIDRSVWIVIAS